MTRPSQPKPTSPASPTDSLPLVKRHLDGVQRETEQGVVSLIQLTAYPPPPPEASSQAHSILQNHVRQNDMLFEVEPGRWVLMVVDTVPDAFPVAMEMASALHNDNVKTSDVGLMELQIRHLGAWSLREGIDDFYGHFEGAMAPPR